VGALSKRERSPALDRGGLGYGAPEPVNKRRLMGIGSGSDMDDEPHIDEEFLEVRASVLSVPQGDSWILDPPKCAEDADACRL
jgi:hypothetical protein